MKNIYLLLFINCLFVKFVLAQKTEVFKPETSLDRTSFTSTSVGVKFTTNGLGLEFGTNLTNTNKMFVRLNYTYLPLNFTNLEIPFDGNTVVADVKVNLGGANIMFDYHPFKNSFKVIFGLGILNTNIKGTGNLKDSSSIGLIKISPEEMGDLFITLGSLTSAPYIGLGLGRTIPKKRVNVNFELGTYYIGSPVVTFKATKLLEPSSANEATLQSNMSEYKWLPHLSLTLNVKLGKIK